MMPEGKRDYSRALEQAWQALAASDIARQTANAGATLQSDGKICLDFIGAHCEIVPSSHQITLNGNDAPDILKILILHYLAKATGAPAQNIDVGFEQIPGATAYSAPFRARAIEPLVRAFDLNESAAVEAFRQIGGTEIKFATRCFVVNVLPRVDVKVIYWKGDEEMPSGGQIVFDRSVSEYLPVEDIAVCCEELAAGIKGMMRQAKPH